MRRASWRREATVEHQIGAQTPRGRARVMPTDERRNDVCGHTARLTTTPSWRNEIVAHSVIAASRSAGKRIDEFRPFMALFADRLARRVRLHALSALRRHEPLHLCRVFVRRLQPGTRAVATSDQRHPLA